eukprot:scaffold78575_cov20-Tisochrysis_lutea.AAC.3
MLRGLMQQRSNYFLREPQAFGLQHKHKSEVHNLMNSRRAQGIQTSLFLERPLSVALQEYAATDVLYLITITERMGCLDSPLCQALSQARLPFCSQPLPPICRGFSLCTWLQQADMHYKERPKQPSSAELEAAAKSIRLKI